MREELADQIEDAGVGRRVGTGRVADRILIDVDDLVDLVQAEDIVVGADGGAGPVQLAGQSVVEDFVDERTLAAAADAGNGDEVPSGKATSMFFRLFWRAPLTSGLRGCSGFDPRQSLRLHPAGLDGSRRFVGTGIAFLPERYCPVSDASPSESASASPSGDLAAAIAGAGAEIEQIIGGGDHLAIMFDQDQRVAEIAQVFQGLAGAGVIARMQADGRFIKDVKDAGQAAADLAGQANALRFAAGQASASIGSSVR